MHVPATDPDADEESEPDVKQPPVPPDQQPDTTPIQEPPKPGENTPMIARGA